MWNLLPMSKLQVSGASRAPVFWAPHSSSRTVTLANLYLSREQCVYTYSFKEILNKCQNFISKQTKIELVIRKPEQGPCASGLDLLPPTSYNYLLVLFSHTIGNSWRQKLCLSCSFLCSEYHTQCLIIVLINKFRRLKGERKKWGEGQEENPKLRIYKVPFSTFMFGYSGQWEV